MARLAVFIGAIAFAVSLAGCSGPAWTESDGARLVSDEAWQWCVDHTDDVAETARSLGVEIEEEGADPVAVYRACVASATAGSDVSKADPADALLSTTREAGFSAHDDEVLRAGIEVCRRFDQSGVTGVSISANVFDVYEAIGPLPEEVVTDPEYLAQPEEFRPLLLSRQGLIEQTTTASKMVVVAASNSICPEYSAEVTRLG